MRHAKAHFERVTAELAAQQAAASGHVTMTGASTYELMLLKLAEDKRRLKDIQSIASKIDLKRQILPEYTGYIDGILTADVNVQDDVFMTVLVWQIDVQDWPQAVRMAAHALRHKLTLPDQYDRTLACLLVEEVAEAALKPDAKVPAQTLQAFEQLTQSEDMPDPVRAKLYKALGYAARSGGDLSGALGWLNRALQANDKCGVKKDIEQIQRELKKTESAETSA